MVYIVVYKDLSGNITLTKVEIPEEAIQPPVGEKKWMNYRKSAFVNKQLTIDYSSSINFIVVCYIQNMDFWATE